MLASPRMSTHFTVMLKVAEPSSLRIRYRSAMYWFVVIRSDVSGALPHSCGV